MKRILLFIMILLIAFSPRLYWSLKSSTPLDIAIVDKTVPNKDYREHGGLFWLLEHKKIVKPNQKLYNIGSDYFGYDPYDQKELPPYNIMRPLDLIYIADTYGVYSDDLKELPEGERSKKLYGGMELTEWNQIMESKGSNTTLIAEFNSFATPTDTTTRKIMEQNLHVDWGGWIGRHFGDLNSDEIPPWLIRNYEKQYKKKWEFEGSGLAFVHTSDQVVVLGEDDAKGLVSFELTKKGQDHFTNVESSNYMYWFDVVAPSEDSNVLATYQLSLSPEGQRQLKEAGIPEEFPAVIHNQQNKTYYFAGDYADYPKPTLPRWEKSPSLLKEFAHDDSDFYWKTYVPLMDNIINKIIELKER